MTDTAFCKMVKQYERLVYTICYQLVRDHHIAEDLTQETFLSAYSHMDSFDNENEKAWLARIAANKAKDHLKSAYTRRVCTPAGETLPEDGQALFIKTESPEAAAEENETMKKVAGEIRGLKEPYAKVAELYFLRDESVEEISNRLNRPRKTVQTQLYRAKNQLRQRLASEWQPAPQA